MSARDSEYGRDFRDEIKVDRFNLELEAERQPGLYQYWSEKLAEAKHARDKFANRLRVRAAEVEIYIRRNPPGDLKLTESIVSALVAENVELQSMNDELADHNRNVAILEGAVRGIDQKKSMIEIETRLWAAGYFANPRIGEDASDAQRRSINKRQTQEEED